ncbi:MAG TPA: acyl-ACP thioesterase domain-containing protein [Candidatus Limnocylindrales bacterium]|jgi:acyl-ACP thioesterase
MTTAHAGPRTGPSFHETAYRVRFDEAGPDGVLRTSGLMRYAQDLAWLHSTALGFGREWYAERGLTWLVRAAELVVLAGAPMGTDVRARTQVVGMRRVFARRRGTFHLADGTLAGWVHTDWVLIDARGALTRIPAIFSEMFGASEAAGSVGRVPLAPTPEGATRQGLTVRPHELDPMAHANNAIYLDWMEEAIGAAGGLEAVAAIPRRYRLEYALAAAGGDELESAAWPTDGSWSYRLIQPSAGSDIFRATLHPGDPGATIEEDG